MGGGEFGEVGSMVDYGGGGLWFSNEIQWQYPDFHQRTEYRLNS